VPCKKSRLDASRAAGLGRSLVRFSKVSSLYLTVYYVVRQGGTPCPFLGRLFSRGANNSKPVWLR